MSRACQPYAGSQGWQRSYLRAFQQREGIAHVYPKVPDGVLDIGMPQKYLNGQQVTGGHVDH